MSTSSEVLISAPGAKRVVAVVSLGWLAYIGLDFLLNAGLLAHIIRWQQPGMLSAKQMFLRIPYGYLSFLLITVLIVWMMVRAHISGLRSGLSFGFKFGLLTGTAAFLGLLSILSIHPYDLLLWSAETLACATLLGAIVGEGLARKSLRRLTGFVVVLFFVCIILAVVIQNLVQGGGPRIGS